MSPVVRAQLMCLTIPDGNPTVSPSTPVLSSVVQRDVHLGKRMQTIYVFGFHHFHILSSCCCARCICLVDAIPVDLLLSQVCMFDHPIKGAQATTAQPSHAPTTAPTPPQPKQPVRQPPKTLLLGLMVDGIWPPGASKEDFLKGALAKHLVGLVDQGGAQGVSVLEKDGQTVYQILMAQAGVCRGDLFTRGTRQRQSRCLCLWQQKLVVCLHLILCNGTAVQKHAHAACIRSL